MNLSKKEKTMLLVLGIFLIGIIYYQFIFLKLVNAVDEKTVEKQEIETKYNNAKATIEAIESQKSKVKILNAKKQYMNIRNTQQKQYRDKKK